MSALLSSLNSSLGSGTVSALATYSNGTYQAYVPGYSADTNLAPSQGIFVRSTALVTKTWTISGSDYPQGTAVILNQGWNLVAAPFPAAGLTTTAIQNEILTGGADCGVLQIVTYSGGAYQPWAPGQAAVPVPATSGMWIRCTTSGVWFPS
jgi:hypothetical protein